MFLYWTNHCQKSYWVQDSNTPMTITNNLFHLLLLFISHYRHTMALHYLPKVHSLGPGWTQWRKRVKYNSSTAQFISNIYRFTEFYTDIAPRIAYYKLRSPLLNPLMITEAKNSRTILMKSFILKHNWQKYLKEKCWSKHYQQLSFKYFVKSFSIQKLWSKVSEFQPTISRGTPKYLWVNPSNAEAILIQITRPQRCFKNIKTMSSRYS